MDSPRSPYSHDRYQSSSTLLEKLQAVLPQGHIFGVYHLSTPPTRTEALFHAPPGRLPDRTYQESHFLSVTTDTKASAGEHATPRPEHAKQVIAFSLEVFIFTTAFSSNFFVSKADSSGYLHLLNLPKGTPSPIREVISTFIAYLVEQRRRRHIQSVVSLFARSQSQYLFPRSVENSGKHVLDDRGLVKWWCRVLDPLIRDSQAKVADTEMTQGKEKREAWKDVKGYLIVPGLDQHETRAFLPRTLVTSQIWELGHPLEEISHYVREAGSTVPPRYLVPQYPDDPKSRFRDELDEEAERLAAEQGAGAWKSVKTLDQFWEMMAFRQECSSGRLTGFIWVVFNPGDTQENNGEPVPRIESRTSVCSSTPEGRQKKKQKKVLRGVIVPRLPRIKTQQRNHLAARPSVTTAYYSWPIEGRGTRVVDESDYKRAVELLLQLDFSTLEKSVISTTRWTNETGMGTDWRLEVRGQRDTAAFPLSSSDGTSASAGDLSGLVKRKRAAGSGENSAAVNMLGGGLVRKKQKGPDTASEKGTLNAEAKLPDGEVALSRVNVLSAGLIRKKPKAA